MKSIEYSEKHINIRHSTNCDHRKLSIKVALESRVFGHFCIWLNKWNCIESCIFREIKNVYNCTFPLSLFAIRGLKLCDLNSYSYDYLRDEFFVGCTKECPLESCFSEKFTEITKSTNFDWKMIQFSFRDLSTLNITQISKVDGFTIFSSFSSFIKNY